MQTDSDLDLRISQWRGFVIRRQPISVDDADELEDHLRNSIAELHSLGLDSQEAFLIAVRRIGALDEVTKEFAREHSERLWKQLVLDGQSTSSRTNRSQFGPAVAFAFLAAVMIKVPLVFGLSFADHGFFSRNLGLFALGPLAAYFCWIRRMTWRESLVVLGSFGAGALAANGFGYPADSMLTLLTAIHLPIALWLVVGFAHADGRWFSATGRMDFIRFTGEWFIYYVLFALGGGVLCGLALGVFAAIGLDVSSVVTEWVLPAGAMGAVIISAWLVEAKQSVVENMAPVLARVFTPLFVVLLVAFVGGALWTQSALQIERELLIVFDLLLALVLGLVIFTISARETATGPGWNDRLQLVLITISLLVDILVLISIGSRILDYGFSANKTAALGENLILMVNLAVSAWLLMGFLRGRKDFEKLSRWQTSYLDVYAVWACLVVVIFPFLFA